jgi:tRNA (guanine-N7-)-methyltransferase
MDEERGVPFPGEVVVPELRTHARVSVPRGGFFDWERSFGRSSAPRVVDLGCGNGRYLIGSALARPTHDHLGIDLVPQAIQHAARRAGERGLANVKFAWGDAEELLFRKLAPGSIDELHVYHPQPYYEPGKVERRLLTPDFFGQAWRVLAPDGVLVLQTDNPYYWSYILVCAPRLFRWKERKEPWPDAPLGRTRREIVAREKGLAIRRGSGAKRPVDPRKVAGIVRAMPRPTFDANRPQFRRPR